jgi:hypothetical protein
MPAKAQPTIPRITINTSPLESRWWPRVLIGGGPVLSERPPGECVWIPRRLSTGFSLLQYSFNFSCQLGTTSSSNPFYVKEGAIESRAYPRIISNSFDHREGRRVGHRSNRAAVLGHRGAVDLVR